MKQSLSLAAFAGLFFLAACTRDLSHYPGNTIEGCNIRDIMLTETGFQDTLTFFYNLQGFPTRAVMTNTGTGNPSYQFRYDKEGRLTDFIGTYDHDGEGTGAAEFWTRYAYGADNRTVYDTTYTLAFETATWPPSYIGDFRTVTKTYDNFGRIVSSSQNVIGPPFVFTQTFTYDRKGNVEGFQYDDKVNLHRTNRVWQFVDDEFSTNNPISATQGIQRYNAFGLPVVEANGPVLFGLIYWTNDTIHYSCDAPAPPKGR